MTEEIYKKIYSNTENLTSREIARKERKMQEEIIIDGVNVAGCDFVSKIGGCDSYTDGVCEGHNCEHKQLKRLAQENKELKKQIESVLEKIKSIVDKFDY